MDFEPEDQDDHYWPNFFHMPVIMLMLITLLNDGKWRDMTLYDIELYDTICDTYIQTCLFLLSKIKKVDVVLFSTYYITLLHIV